MSFDFAATGVPSVLILTADTPPTVHRPTEKERA
jgi:hypothetical protein